ncbi:hypothetical protein [Bacillus sp. TL12]|uniref:hypothetical protein n=1 Tax=Bacillus sp. TL12 TaxID=2894756 RepID=UPI001F52085C|nr:hypothetical protein [Bacillus sp. TL12]MCI0764729.1 hypothetical protein [Bacillus sp. TL12]
MRFLRYEVRLLYGMEMEMNLIKPMIIHLIINQGIAKRDTINLITIETLMIGRIILFLMMGDGFSV